MQKAVEDAAAAEKKKREEEQRWRDVPEWKKMVIEKQAKKFEVCLFA